MDAVATITGHQSSIFIRFEWLHAHRAFIVEKALLLLNAILCVMSIRSAMILLVI
jgi:hypothetical protein